MKVGGTCRDIMYPKCILSSSDQFLAFDPCQYNAHAMGIILVEDKMKNESSLSDKNYNKISDH